MSKWSKQKEFLRIEPQITHLNVALWIRIVPWGIRNHCLLILSFLRLPFLGLCPSDSCLLRSNLLSLLFFLESPALKLLLSRLSLLGQLCLLSLPLRIGKDQRCPFHTECRVANSCYTLWMACNECTECISSRKYCNDTRIFSMESGKNRGQVRPSPGIFQDIGDTLYQNQFNLILLLLS